MELIQWYAKNKRDKKITIAEIAKKIGCSANHLNQIILSERLPSHQLGRKIEFFTKQEVRYSEIVEAFFNLHPERYKYDFD